MATAIEAALAAGRVHRRYFRQDLRVEKKGPIDLVTAADVEAEQGFRELIGRRFPDHVVLGEEGAGEPAPDGPYRWIIDPLDGTTNFAHGLALFSVSIALEVDGQLVVGVVYDPIADELFAAERGSGARVNGAPLRVSRQAPLDNAMVVTGFPYTVRQNPSRQMAAFDAFVRSAQAVRRLGSAALDLCYVAAGRFDGYWEEQLHPWDIAAGVLIVQESGGTVTGYFGQPPDVQQGQLVASNGLVHDAMLAVLARTATAAPGSSPA